MISLFPLMVFVILFETQSTTGYVVEKRTAAASRDAEDYPDYQLGVRYDEYPMIVPKRKSAILDDRLVIAFEKALDEERKKMSSLETYAHFPNDIGSIVVPKKKSAIMVDRLLGAYKKALDDDRSNLMPNSLIQNDIRARRGDEDKKSRGHLAWRCYFNAVTCF